MNNDCKYNAGLLCDPRTRICKGCGWEPEEDKRRRAMIAQNVTQTAKGRYKPLKIRKE